jgi:hypothetical protein
MALFSFSPADALSPASLHPNTPGLESAITSPGVPAFGLPRGDGGFAYLPETEPVDLVDGSLGDQFLAFYLNPEEEGDRILESSQVAPSVEGGADQPDIMTKVQLEAFHVGQGENVDRKTRATLRMTLGKDKSSTDRVFDDVFWAVAAGLRLYDDSKKKRSSAKDLSADFDQALGKRPIEVPGGLGLLSFEVVRHREPPWWRRIFSFVGSGTGRTLISALGFPALTLTAVNVVDELLNRLDRSEPHVLFKSRPLRLAFSEYAKQQFGGGATTRVGSMTPGRWLLARGRDYATMLREKPVFWPAYGRLFPAEAELTDVVNGNDGGLGNLTYGVLRVGIRAAKLDPQFNYGA